MTEPRAQHVDRVVTVAIQALEDLKGQDIRTLDVVGKTDITDVLIIASGTSARHVKALADSVIEKVKQAGIRPLGVEGEQDAEWVLVDLCDVVVHVMLPRVRDYYNLENLWSVSTSAKTDPESGTAP